MTKNVNKRPRVVPTPSTKDKNRQLGEAARGIRQDVGLSIQKMADVLGCSLSHMSKLELGQAHWSEKWQERFEKATGIE